MTNWTLENKYLLHQSLKNSTLKGTILYAMNVVNSYGKGLLIMSVFKMLLKI
jgi:hypothetical protein